MKKHIGYILLAALLPGLAGCENWLENKTLSDYTGENAFVDYNGMYTATIMLDRDYRYLEYYPTAFSADPRYLTELFFSDIAVNGRTDAAASPQDLIRQINPSEALTGSNRATCHAYWSDLYKGIKDANTIISRIDAASFESEVQKNEILATAYFHRALRYYRLVHQFGDVPLLLEEIAEPRYNFYSTKREVTLRRMKSDLESTIEYLPTRSTAAIGRPTQGAANHLLTKINLALCEFDDAIASASAVIDGGYRLMQSSDYPDGNVMWNLHRTENKALPTNFEALYVLIDRYGDTDAQTVTGLEIMRQAVPWWTATGRIKTPDKLTDAFVDNDEVKNPEIVTYGRGLATARSTWYATNMIWEEKLEDELQTANGGVEVYNDLRHDRKSGNWMAMEDLKFSNPALATTQWYGKNLVRWNYKMSDAENLARGAAYVVPTDTIRCWMEWPQYKTWVADQKANNWRGGWGDWYVFRLAETYLLRAEAYLWKNEPGLAMADINQVRTRANARPITMAEATMATLIDERARELYYEEPRKTELTRIAYIYAETGKATDNPKFPGKTYSLANFSEDNFWFDQIQAHTEFYNQDPLVVGFSNYTIAPHHVLWPIRETVIDENMLGHINQNKGYAGAETNIEPIDHEN